MATQQIKDILGTEVPKPSFVLSPSVPAPLPSGVTVTRNGQDNVARTLDPYSGKFEQVGEDTARVYGSDQSLLVEAAGRTNYLKYSIDASNFKRAGCTVGGTPASIIDGGTARTLTAGTTSERYVKYIFPGAEVTSTQACKFIIEEGSSVQTRLAIYNKSNNTLKAAASLDWSSETIFDIITTDLDSSNVRIITKNGPNGGKVAEVVLRITASSAYNREMWVLPDDTNGSGYMIIHGMQIENAVNSSSIIESTTSATTRAADDYTIWSGSQPSWWNPNEGTFLIEYLPQVFYIGGFNNILTGSGSDERIYIGTGGSSSPFRVTYFNGTNNNAFVDGNVESFAKSSIGLSFSGDDAVLSVDGASATGTSSNNGFYNENTALKLGSQIKSGIFREVIYYPRALPESTLNTLTT